MKRAILSASNLAAAALCPGKPRMETGIAEESSQYSERGTALHPYFRTRKDRSTLSVDDRELMEASDSYAEKLLAMFRETVGIVEEELYTEEHEVALDGIVPGHPDDLISWPRIKAVAILDLKSGMMAQDQAQDNYQLADYAALAWQREPFDVCGVAIVQPDALGPRMTTAIYRAADMPGLIAEITAIRDATLKPDAPLVAGEKQCHFCKAKVICPAYKAKMLPVIKYGDASKEEIVTAIKMLPDDKVAELKTAGLFWGRIEDAVNDEMRLRIEGGEMPGWTLRNAGDVRECRDTTGFFNAWMAYFAGNPKSTASAFDKCRVFSVGKGVDLVMELTGLAKKKSAELFNAISDPFMSRTPKAKSVVREKGAA